MIGKRGYNLFMGIEQAINIENQFGDRGTIENRGMDPDNQENLENPYRSSRAFTSFFEGEFIVKCCVKEYLKLPNKDKDVFLSFIENAPEDQKARLKDFCRDFIWSGFRAFLSFYPTGGTELFVLMDKLNTGGLEHIDCAVLLNRYIKVIDTGRKAKKFLYKLYPTLSNNNEMADKIENSLLEKANQMFNQIINRLNKGEKLNPFQIVESLVHAHDQVALFVETIKTLKQEGQILDFSELENLKFEIVRGGEISEDDIRLMHWIYSQNWKHKTTPEYWGYLEKKFLESSANPSAKFKILKFDRDIVAFVRFIDEQDGDGKNHIHAGALNVSTPYQNGKIGEIFINQALVQEKSRNLPIMAETNPNNLMLKKYLALGFKEVGRTSYLGEPEVKLEIKPQQQDNVQN